VLPAGVTGIGGEDSKVALYEDAEGDRGIIAVEVNAHPIMYIYIYITATY
jgi:hypothetical protein